MLSCSLIDRNIGSWFRSGVQSPGTDQPVMVLLLDDMGAPSGDARTHKHRCVQLARNAYQEIGDGRIEIQIRVEPFLLLHHTVDGGSDLVPAGVTADPTQLVGVSLDDCGPGISLFQHAMTESHDSAFGGEGFLD